jgi:hypothetical protein
MMRKKARREEKPESNTRSSQGRDAKTTASRTFRFEAENPITTQ